MERKKISVCIASYNGAQFIKEQIDSILSQLSRYDEVIISDDGSSDRTLDILKKYNDQRIRIFINTNKKGVISNFENALKKASGDYIFLCDQDDIWRSNKISEVTCYLKDYDLVVSDCFIIDENKNVICDSFFQHHGSYSGFWKNFMKNSYLGCCMAFKKEILTYILPFPRYIAMHDIWIGLSVELNGNALFLKKPLMLYRRHGNNASSSSEKSKFSFSYKITYRFQMLYYLLKRKFIH